MKNSLQEINKQRRREVASVAAPTPGEMVQRGDDDDSGPNFVNAPPTGGSLRVSGASVLATLGQQQDTMDTVQAGNTTSNTTEAQHTNLGALFTPPIAESSASAPTRQEELEFQKPGAMDFRAALLVEQEQQQAILAERQRMFEESHTHNHESKSESASSLDSSASPKSSVILTYPQPPISILKSPAERSHSSNLSDTNSPDQIMGSPEDHLHPTSPQMLRPAAASARTRGISAPPDYKTTNVPAGHNRKVSWGVDQFHITKDNTRNDGLGSSHRSGMSSEQSAPASTGRPKLLSEDSKIDLRSIIGTTPFESEAETNILRAVDEFRLQDQYASAKSESPPFFSNLPPEFSLPPPEIPSSNNNDDTRVSGHKKMISELSGGSMGSPLPRPRLTPHPSVLDGSLESQRPAVPQLERPKQRPSLEKIIGNRRLPAHRHTQSVEQRLFGLTTAMAELDKKSTRRIRTDSDASDSPDGIAHQQLVGDRRSNMQKSHRRFVSSADRLAERAQILVSRAMGSGGKENNAPPGLVVPATGGNGSGDDIEAPPGDMNAVVDHSRTYSGDSLPQQTTGSDNSPSGPSSPGSSRGRHPSTIEEDDEEDSLRENVEDSAIFQKKSGIGILGTLNPYDFLNEAIREDWETFTEFLNPRRKSAWVYCKNILLFLLLPSTAISALFFYFIEDNETSESAPNTGNTTATDLNPEFEFAGASVSWWILFIGVRQVLTLSLAIATQSFVVDFLVLGSRFALRCLGPVVTLLLVQSKGWPFILFFWAMYDLALLSGSRQFVHHWAYWQDVILMFTAENPSGEVTSNSIYLLLIRLSMIVAGSVAVKRFLVGIFLGRQTFLFYGEELAKVMKRMVLVSEVASLSRLPLPRYLDEKEPTRNSSVWRKNKAFMSDDTSQTSQDQTQPEPLEMPILDEINKGANKTDNIETQNAEENVPAHRSRAFSAGTLSGEATIAFSESNKQLITDLLERWEEPNRVNTYDSKASLSSVLQFRRALTVLRRGYPFSAAFGPSRDREMCIESAQRVFSRLLLRSADREDDLNFDVLAVLAVDDYTGELDDYKLKQLIKIFRPDRDGRLTELAFVKSVDAVYRRMRLLEANIHNSSQIDIATEKILNIGFYFLLGSVILGALGIDPFQLFFSLSSFVLAFAFMFGNAAASYFSGVLLILVQRPFGVGDRIHVSNSESEVSPDGSSGWIVEKVDLFSTAVCFGTTNERATVSNGTLASSRIINAARSPNAVVYVNLKFGIDVPYQKIQIFQAAIETHVKARPREWLAFLGFRAGAISVDRGYIEYKAVVQHRDSWQNIVSILQSKARLTAYSLEVAKQLNMRYVSPPLPVDLNVQNSNGPAVPLEYTMSNPVESIEKTA